MSAIFMSIATPHIARPSAANPATLSGKTNNSQRVTVRGRNSTGHNSTWTNLMCIRPIAAVDNSLESRPWRSRMLFVRAYPREMQEVVFDAHDRAFALFKGTCSRGIYDNMKTAVETIFVG